MGSSSARNPYLWQPPAYDPCSLGICTMYCPQWCMFFPPPPDSSGSGTYFSPLVISVIVILASAFALVSYFIIFKKTCGRGRNPQSGGENLERVNNRFLWSTSPTGLDESAIKSIAVYKYKKGEGLVDGTDCSVCLSEFQDDESLRLLPKCNHAFHLPCIDTWLKSHSNCPLCRANVTPSVNSSTPYELPLTVLSSPSPTDHDDTSTSPADNISAESVTAVRRDEVVVTVDISAESSEGEGRVRVADVSSEGRTEDVNDGRIKAKTIGPSKSFRSDESSDRRVNSIPVLRRAISTGGFVHRK